MQSVTQLVFLHAPRKDFAYSMTNAEKQAMTEHAVYQNDLCNRGYVIFAGPSIEEENTYGIIIIRGTTREHIREMIENDPAVKAGAVRAEYRQLVASIFDDSRSRSHVRAPNDKVIYKAAEILASVPQVWSDFTTAEGIASLFGADAKIELWVGGRYEIYFSTDAPEGLRGSEGCRILSFIPNEMLSFSWNAPPQFASVRERRTHVVVQFQSTGTNATHVTISHLGWQSGGEWDDVFAYFDKAWQFVIDNLAKKYGK